MDYTQEQLLKQLAREGLMHRGRRLAIRKIRLEQSKREIEELARQVEQAEAILGRPTDARGRMEY